MRSKKLSKVITLLLSMMVVFSMNTTVYGMEIGEDVARSGENVSTEGQDTIDNNGNHNEMNDNSVEPDDMAAPNDDPNGDIDADNTNGDDADEDIEIRAGFTQENPLVVGEEGLAIQDGVFYGIKKTWFEGINPNKETMYLSVCLPDGVTTIGDGALQYNFTYKKRDAGAVTSNDGLGTIEILSLDLSQAVSLTTIEQQAALGNKSLSGVLDLSATKVETIGKSAFSECISLTGVILPSRLKTLGNPSDGAGNVFHKCTGLLYIRTAGKSSDAVFELPDTLTFVGRQTFQDCFAKGVDAKVVLPAAVNTVGSQAFKSDRISQILVMKKGDAWNPVLKNYDTRAFDTGNKNTLVVFQDTKSYNDYVLGRSFTSSVMKTLAHPITVTFAGTTQGSLRFNKLNYQSLKYAKNSATGFWEKDESFTLPVSMASTSPKPGYEYGWTFEVTKGKIEQVTEDYVINTNITNPKFTAGSTLMNPTIVYTANGQVQNGNRLTVEIVDGKLGQAGVAVSHPLCKEESGTDENYVFFKYVWWDEVNSLVNGPRSEAEADLFSHEEGGELFRVMTDKAEIPITGKDHERTGIDQYMVEIFGYIVEDGNEPKKFYQSAYNFIDIGSSHNTDKTVDDTYTMQVEVALAYTVTFDANGGKWQEGEADVDSKTVKVLDGQQVQMAEAPTKEGSTFKGWSDGEKLYEPEELLNVTGKTNLTALWQLNETPTVPIIPVGPVTPELPKDIDDPDTPLEPEPGIDEPTIDDPDVPKEEKPDQVEIEDGKTPTDMGPATDVPKTDDNMYLWVFLWMTVMLASGMACVALKKKY
ncbi:MAG: leucine-rich repeat protein [Firmicutes bacterium]|nr:leucine-rich repeat protein [Bacillota bacterium]